MLFHEASDFPYATTHGQTPVLSWMAEDFANDIAEATLDPDRFFAAMYGRVRI
jgi:hypothetical protein